MFLGFLVDFLFPKFQENFSNFQIKKRENVAITKKREREKNKVSRQFVLRVLQKNDRDEA